MKPRVCLGLCLSTLLLLPAFMEGGPVTAVVPAQAPVQVKTDVNLATFELMVAPNGGDFETWNLSFASGTYTQAFDDRTVTGKIADLGALQLGDGSVYPMFVAEGQTLVVQAGVAPQKIAKVSNEGAVVLSLAEKVWSSPDGKATVLLAKGTSYLVLDPKGFPAVKTVIGIADSTTLYLYPKR